MNTTMTEAVGPLLGRVATIWRYPVKSMMGEELNASDVTEHDLLGDRQYALIDVETGKIASAKNPRRWPNLFDFRAQYVEPAGGGQSLPAIRITLPDGESLRTDEADVEQHLSAAVGRSVRLARSPSASASAEGYWPDHAWLAQRDEFFEFPLSAGTFFDAAAVHLVTTATLDRLRTSSPASRFEVARFRPNFVIQAADGYEGFVENAWIGQTLALGEVQLRIDEPCPRCIMTTLSQGSLPKDPGVLRSVVQENGGNVGVYATVVAGGRVRRSDAVCFVAAKR